MKYVVAYSGGKDSTATVILAHLLGMPIDYILFSEVMFDDVTSCELPEHMDFIKNVAFPRFESWGFKTRILHHDRTYMDYFNQVRRSGANIGKRVGFPMADKCNAKNCKIKPIRAFIAQLGECTEYVGYTADEPKRLVSLRSNGRSLLAENGFDKEMSRTLCEEYGLLSPYYEFSKRGGCWCCPNASLSQLMFLRKHHPSLWKKLLELEKEENLVGYIFNTRSGLSVAELEERFLREQSMW